MIPSFDIGPLSFPAYFTLLTFGFILAIWLAWRQTERLGINPNHFLDLAIIMLVAGVLGARLLHVVADGYFQDYVNLCVDPYQVEGRILRPGWVCNTDADCVGAKLGELCHPENHTCHPARDCFRWLKFWHGGLAYYGGFLAAFLAVMWYARRKRMPFLRVADLTGFGIPLGLVFGRIGCFFAGCCYGYVTETSVGLHFPHGSPAWRDHAARLADTVCAWIGCQDVESARFAVERLAQRNLESSLPVHPTQIYHIVGNLAVFVICYWIFLKRRTFDGKVFWWFWVLYGVTRSVVEFWRDDARGVWFGETISTSQLISIPLVLFAAFMLWRGSRKAAEMPPPAAADPPPADPTP